MKKYNGASIDTSDSREDSTNEEKIRAFYEVSLNW